MSGPDAAVPRTLFTDRGPGFYVSGIRNGEIVAAYNEALRAEEEVPVRLREPRWRAHLRAQRAGARVDST